jgi:hypothetical protein
MRIYRRWVLFIVFGCCWCINLKAVSINPRDKRIDDIIGFCKLYGYVRYFHPSDEASQIDWDGFAVWGIRSITNLKEGDKLMDCLNSMFVPIAPTLKISDQPFSKNYKSPGIFVNLKNAKTTCWQHFGVQGLDLNSVYRSIRTNRSSVHDLFSETLKIGDCITDKISSELYCYVPLCLYIKDSTTFPKSDPVKLEQEKTELAKINTNDTALANRIGSVIVTWNLIQHFYPYRDKMDHWDQSLRDAIVKCYQDATVGDFVVTLNLLLAHINDGHAFATSKALPPIFLPPMDWKYLHDTLVVSEIFDSTKIESLQIGDVVMSIDGHLATKKIEETMMTKSASTLRYKRFLAVFSLLKGQENSIVKLKVSRKGEVKDIAVKRTVGMPYYWQNYMSPGPKYKAINDSTIYVNFAKASLPYIDSLMPTIKSKKFIICDLRGYPNGNHQFLSHLLPLDDTAKSWFRIPQIMLPNYKNVRYSLSGWNLKKSDKLNTKAVFIVDQEVVSYGESFMSIVENYKLGIIVGDSTAGTNGNMNAFNLPFNGCIVKFTGMNVTKLNGDKLVGVGVIPGVVVKPSVRGVIMHKDELLNKAIEITLNYNQFKGR